MNLFADWYLGGAFIFLVGVYIFLVIFRAGLLELYFLIVGRAPEEVIHVLESASTKARKNKLMRGAEIVADLIWGDVEKLETRPAQLTYRSRITLTIIFGAFNIGGLVVQVGILQSASNLPEKIASLLWLLLGIWVSFMNLYTLYEIVKLDRSLFHNQEPGE